VLTVAGDDLYGGAEVHQTFTFIVCAGIIAVRYVCTLCLACDLLCRALFCCCIVPDSSLNRPLLLPLLCAQMILYFAKVGFKSVSEIVQNQSSEEDVKLAKALTGALDRTRLLDLMSDISPRVFAANTRSWKRETERWGDVRELPIDYKNVQDHATRRAHAHISDARKSRNIITMCDLECYESKVPLQLYKLTTFWGYRFFVQVCVFVFAFVFVCVLLCSFCCLPFCWRCLSLPVICSHSLLFVSHRPTALLQAVIMMHILIAFNGPFDNDTLKAQPLNYTLAYIEAFCIIVEIVYVVFKVLVNYRFQQEPQVKGGASIGKLQLPPTLWHDVLLLLTVLACLVDFGIKLEYKYSFQFYLPIRVLLIVRLHAACRFALPHSLPSPLFLSPITADLHVAVCLCVRACAGVGERQSAPRHPRVPQHSVRRPTRVHPLLLSGDCGVVFGHPSVPLVLEPDRLRRQLHQFHSSDDHNVCVHCHQRKLCGCGVPGV
jgi:hypothetical protein